MRPFVVLIALVVLLGAVISTAAEPAKAPDDVVKVLRFYVGQWTLEGKEGDSPVTGKATFRMPPGKHCVMGTVSSQLKGEPVHFSLVTGWDSSTGWCTEQGAVSDGTIYTIHWHKASATVCEGELTGTLNGKKMTEKDRVERKGENEFVVTCTDRKLGDDKLPDQNFTYRRIPRDKAKTKSAK